MAKRLVCEIAGQRSTKNAVVSAALAASSYGLWMRTEPNEDDDDIMV